MEVWVTCPSCQAHVGPPTARQVLKRKYGCPNCGVPLDPIKTQEDVLIEILDRIEALEARILPPEVPLPVNAPSVKARGE